MVTWNNMEKIVSFIQCTLYFLDNFLPACNKVIWNLFKDVNGFLRPFSSFFPILFMMSLNPYEDNSIVMCFMVY